MTIYLKLHKMPAVDFSMLKIGTNIYFNNNQSPTNYYKNNKV